YPLWTLLPLLGKEGKLTEAQAKFLASYRPYEELYDLQADPHEVENLAESEDHQNVLNDLSARLDNWIETYGDQGEIPEDPEVIAAQAEDMYDKHRSAPDSQLSPEEYIKTWEQKLLG
ncbi:MAG: DUF4976 domain-containing protein, partial [Gemmatimonadetes bacterium]|nr:DUF4976 domain-containing protein [Gemmatimonadota bacterium]